METLETVTVKKKKGISKKKKGFFSAKTKLILGILGGILSIAVTLLGLQKAYINFITPDVSGQWYLTLTVKKSTYHAYIGDVIGIRAYLTQTENGVTGNGEKWDYRGERLPYNQHRKLEFVGAINGKDFRLKYVLHGELAETTGIIEVKITDGGKKMEGSFVGTAADSKGTIVGIKED
jgi:hypothetical protein